MKHFFILHDDVYLFYDIYLQGKLILYSGDEFFIYIKIFSFAMDFLSKVDIEQLGCVP